MRSLCLVVLAACGGGGAGLEVEESSCAAGRFHFVHDLAISDGGDAAGGGEGDLSINGHSFVNALGGEPGRFQIFGSGSGTSSLVDIEFEELLAVGDTVPARGVIRLAEQGIDAGNCEAAAFSGRISDLGNGWKFTLVDLHAEPFCSGAAFSGSFAGCTLTTR